MVKAKISFIYQVYAITNIEAEGHPASPVFGKK